jgi:hypothetical protein
MEAEKPGTVEKPGATAGIKKGSKGEKLTTKRSMEKPGNGNPPRQDRRVNFEVGVEGGLRRSGRARRRARCDKCGREYCVHTRDD